VRKKGLFAAAAAFAASPQGQRLMRQAKDYVQSPQGRAKLAELKDQLGQRKGGATPQRPSGPTSTH
jgi:CHASE3 domain sensor protein